MTTAKSNKINIGLNELKFPVGECLSDKYPSQETLQTCIRDIEEFPEKVEKLIAKAPVESLNWKYRPEGWMVKQVVHHCADSHMNSLIRFKLALTEESPTIRPYHEDRWANLADSLTDDVEESLMLLKGLHKKWARLLKSLSTEDLSKTFVHPEHGQEFTVAENIGIYAWHCNHHLAHIENGIMSNGNYN